MLSKSTELKKYAKYVIEIEELKYDQMDAGAMFGRANLIEISSAYKRLVTRIKEDDSLSVEHKNEILSRALEIIETLPKRDEEISRAEEEFPKLSSQYPESEREKTKELVRKISKNPSDKSNKLIKKLFVSEYLIFFTPEELQKIAMGDGEGLRKAYDRVKKEYPNMAPDIEEEVDYTHQKDKDKDKSHEIE